METMLADKLLHSFEALVTLHLPTMKQKSNFKQYADEQKAHHQSACTTLNS
jgi:hypothetical protein